MEIALVIIGILILAGIICVIVLLRQHSTDRYSEITREAMQQASDKFRDTNSNEINKIVIPLRERLDMLGSTISRVQESNTRHSAELRQRIDDLAIASSHLMQDARNLTDALKGKSKIQGDWGEMILQTLLESAGMKEGEHFISQATRDEYDRVLKSVEGNNLRPDFIVYVAGGRKLIIDSKVSLTAYTRLHEATDEDERKMHCEAHLNSVRKHVKELADMKYQKAVKGAMDQVIMFIPNEGAWIDALSADASLWQYAYDRHVVIASPTHLLSLIHLLAQFRREEALDRNSQEIARIGGLVYDGLCDLLNKVEKVGNSIDASRKCYEDLTHALDLTNPRGVLRRASKLPELGAKVSKRLDTD